MPPVETTCPCLVRFLSDAGLYPRPNYGTRAATVLFATSVGAAAPMGLAGFDVVAIATVLTGGTGAAFLALRAERNLPAGERRHRAACAVRARLKAMMTSRTLHRALDPVLLDLLDEGAKQYLLSRGHAGKIAHALTAQADAAAVATMDDLLLEVGLNLPYRVAPRSFNDAIHDTFATPSMSFLSSGLGRFLGSTPPPEPDYDAIRRVRPHVQALADLASEIERTLPALVQTMDLPGGEPPISKTLDALREHREARESLERELRLGG